MVDRYTKVVLTVIAICLVIMTVTPLLEIRPAQAGYEADASKVGAGAEPKVIPKSWGRLASAVPAGNYVLLVFEAQSGEINWTRQPIVYRKIARE